ncbi:MAG: tRNA threonylcarbamoyladenosine dehydratase [Ruminococcaceae bacterium]|nr:tRNA threonylcarbamoyladenosine dehydratase [Oscillospiraceae bacterium]
MKEYFSRTISLIGEDSFLKLNNSHVAVFGVGGVGGYVCEALVRSGVGKLTIVDNDTVSPSNINRQIIATSDTIGKDKVDVAKERFLSINPNAEIIAKKEFFMPDTSHKFDFSEYDYVVDAIDTVTGKIEIILKAKEEGVPVISSMGTGNKLDPTLFEIDDIYKTSVCPLAKVMRYELKKRNVDSLKVLYSKEKPIIVSNDDESVPGRRHTPSSISFVPSVAGLIIAGEVIKDIIK